MTRACKVILLLACALVGCRPQPEAPPPPVRLALQAPEGVELGALDAAISPDETQIVFVGTSDGVTQLWRRAMADERAEPLSGTEGAQLPAWKGTGNVISFFAGGRLKQITLRDGRIGDLAPAPAPSGAAWLSDGSLLFAAGTTGPIRRLLDGQITEATILAEGDTGHLFPAPRAGTRDFVYVALQSGGRRVVRLATGNAQHDLTTTSGHAVLFDNVLLHVDDGVLLAYRYDDETKRLRGRGIPIALNSGISDAGAGLFAASPHLLIHWAPAPRAREVVWLDPTGANAGTVGDVGDHWQVRLSRDDRHVATASVDALLRTLDVFITPSAGGYTERLTLSLAAETAPVWSPDGTRVLFRSLHDGVPNLFARDALRNSLSDEVILDSPLDETPTDWGVSGDILFHAGGKVSLDIYRLRPDGTYEAIVQSGFNESDARWSPDGRLIAYAADESGQSDVYVNHPDRSRHRISFSGGTRPRWGRDGRTLYFLRGSQLFRATVETNSLRFANAQPIFEVPGIVDYDVAHRSDRFIVIRNKAAADAPPPGVVLNWRSAISGR